MQSFLSVLRKIAGGVQTGLNVGQNLGLFSTGPAQTAATEISGTLSWLHGQSG